MPPKQPYDYQEHIIRQSAMALHSGLNKVLVQAPTGAGKTVVFSFIAQRFILKSTQDVIIFVHRKELLTQTRKTIFETFGISAQPITAGMKHVPKARIYIAMIESAKNRMPSNLGLVMVDECFIAGTQVSGKNIEDIVVGDMVDSYNHSTGLIEKKTVLATSKKEINQELLLITFSCEQFVCTHDHPIFVEGKGYVPAKELQENDIAYGLNKLHPLQRGNKKRKFYSISLELESTFIQKKGKNFLHSLMQIFSLRKNALGKNDSEKSNDESRIITKNDGFIKEDWTQANYTRRQRKGNDCSSKNVTRGTWGRMVSRISSGYRWWVCTASLQNRHWVSREKNSNRSRWRDTRFGYSKKKRSAENGFINKQRVQSIEVYKQSDIGECERSSISNFVYNLEVEGNNNYFANNILVHNCHIASLHKAHTFAEGIRILGFSATPISANKKVPLNGIYQTLIPGPQISTLIERGKLCQNITIAPKNIVDRNKLAVKGGEFNETIMGQEFSKGKHVKNTLKYYRKLIDGKKTLIFNCNISHSIEVTREFVAAGLNCRHLDSENCTDFERTEILTWLKHTPNAILSSVGILTTGFDEPSIEAIVVNRSIMSVALWLQITGRGGRSHPGKEIFYVIDMGGNAVNLGDWSDDRDWVDIFNNPPSPSKNAGIAPCKSCPQCDCIIPAPANVCKFCGYQYPAAKPSKEEEVSEEYTILTKGIDISKYMARSEKLGHRKYASFYEIGKRIVKNAPSGTPKSTILKTFYSEAKKWCQLNGKSWNVFHRGLVDDFVAEVQIASETSENLSPTKASQKEFTKLQPPISQLQQNGNTQQHSTLTSLKPLTTLPSWL